MTDTRDDVTLLAEETTSLRCPCCKERNMRIRSSWRVTKKTVYARMECTGCGHVVNATIKPAVIVSYREVERKNPKQPAVSTLRDLFE
jgi:hypothetical protein